MGGKEKEGREKGKEGKMKVKAWGRRQGTNRAMQECNGGGTGKKGVEGREGNKVNKRRDSKRGLKEGKRIMGEGR